MLDELDVKILNIIQANARVSQADVARTVGLAPSAVLERLRKLEAKGVLRGYAALLDPNALDLRQLAYVAVRTAGAAEITDRAGEALANFPEVQEVHHVAGEDCYLLKLRARDAQHVGQLLRRMQATVPGVTSTRTTIVLDTLKETPRLPLPITAAPDKGTPDKGAPEKRTPDRGTPDGGTPDSGTPEKGGPETAPPRTPEETLS